MLILLVIQLACGKTYVAVFSDVDGNIAAQFKAKSTTSDSTSADIINAIDEALADCQLQFPFDSVTIQLDGCTGMSFVMIT